MSKSTSLWGEGVYSGMLAVSGEILVGARAEVWRTRTVQRRPQSERWAAGAAGEMVGGVPWHMLEEDEDADGPSVKAQLQLGTARARGRRRADGGGRSRIAPYEHHEGGLGEVRLHGRMLGVQSVAHRTIEAKTF